LVFDRIEASIQKGFDIEAIALLESLMCDRLSSRLAYKTNKEFDIKLTLAQACSQLLALSEDSSEFRESIVQIRGWAKQRNKAVHEIAKIYRSDAIAPQHFRDVLTDNHQFALRGVELLRDYDELDRKDRGKSRRNPASHPAAFFPERRTKGAQTFIWLEMQGLLPKHPTTGSVDRA
jgi:hypothetical protein